MEYSYNQHKLQKIKVWNYKPNQTTYIYIHGGAWRDPNWTYDQLEPVVRNDNFTYIGINYRLSPDVKHPDHLIDILQALQYIKQNFEVGDLHILGYSCGATLILQLLNFEEIIEMGLQAFGLSKTSLPDLCNLIPFIYKNIKFKSLRFLDGIYDPLELIEEYPDYSSFIEAAFVKTVVLPNREATISSIQQSTQLCGNFNDIPFSLVDKDTKFIIVQSLEDDLLTMSQTKCLIEYFTNKKQPLSLNTGLYGKHNDLYGEKRRKLFIE
ncbi:unnamed protein product [Candida verbasci]|uniref:Kynurenine formamidase n=1 Tax=Candida verbasci TaxID=1227364 RepID=A0A9W4XFZ2_9ASCO|nr:unnamed protein product [Candida verbasci]